MEKELYSYITIDPYGQVPAIKPNFEEAEQATAFAYACSPQTIPPPLKPVSTADLQRTLKVRNGNFLGKRINDI